MPNVPMNISKVLAEQSANTDITKNHNLNPDAVSKLNYEVMYKMLEGEVEKLILENQGKKIIESKENRLIMFDSMIKHRSKKSNNSKERYILNFNYF